MTPRQAMQKGIERYLKDSFELSDRQIARAMACDHKTVAAARRRLEAAGEIPQLSHRKGLDMKTRRVPWTRKTMSRTLKDDAERPNAVTQDETNWGNSPVEQEGPAKEEAPPSEEAPAQDIPPYLAYQPKPAVIPPNSIIPHESTFCGRTVWPRADYPAVTEADVMSAWQFINLWTTRIENGWQPQKPREVAVMIRHLINDLREGSSLHGLTTVMEDCITAYDQTGGDKIHSVSPGRIIRHCR